MEVDDLIAKHQQRLQQHRRFLAEENGIVRLSNDGGQNSLEETGGSSSSTAKASPHVREFRTREEKITSTLARALEASEGQEAMDEFEPQPRSGRHSPAAEVEQIISMDDDEADHAAGDLRHSQKPAYHHRSGSSSTKKQQGAAKSAQDVSEGSGKGFFGFASELDQQAAEDRLLQQHLQEAGRYYVAGPSDSMYQRSVWWLSNRERLRKERLRTQEEAALAQCTFKPTLQTAASNDATHWATASATPQSQHGGDGAKSTLAATPSGSRGSPQNTSSQKPQRSVSPTVGEHQHTMRQQHARQLREEAKRRLQGPDISSWSPRQTVPKEFELGKRTVAVASLRQPVWSGSSRASSVLANHGSSTNAEGAAPVHISPSSQAQDNSSPARTYSDENDHRASGHASLALQTAAATIHKLETENEQLRKQLLEQQVTLQSTRRELELAKNMVRRMTLQGNAQ